MAMQEILDSVRRIIHKWVNTTTRITQNVAKNQKNITVQASGRFLVGDQVVISITDSGVVEPGVVHSVDYDNNIITLCSNISNNYTTSATLMLVKTFHNNFVQGIYIGEPDVISHYPAITVNGVSRSSEWLTLESTKERYEIEIGIYVKAATNEEGYRFLMTIADIIQAGLKRNILPLINDLDIISLTEDAKKGDATLKISDASKVAFYKRIILEDASSWQENWVDLVYTDENTIKIAEPSFYNFNKEGTSVLVPHRFIFNSWPSSIEYGKIHKGELLKAAVIKWFAEEEELQWFRREEPNLR